MNTAHVKISNSIFHILLIIFLMATILFIFSCSSSGNKESAQPQNEENTGANLLAEGESEDDAMIKEGKGIGPVKSVTVGAIDNAMAEEGKKVFEAKCTACHKTTEEKYVGPGLKGVTQRRKPEWIMNQILNPAEMTQKDPTAKYLLATHLTQMTNQNLTQDDARKVLEYFRKLDTESSTGAK